MTDHKQADSKAKAAAAHAVAHPTAAPALHGQTIVLKLGSSSVSDSATGHLRLSGLSRLCETIVQLMQTGNHRVVLVTSGTFCTFVCLPLQISGFAADSLLIAADRC
jgi:hypothetical protein